MGTLYLPTLTDAELLAYLDSITLGTIEQHLVQRLRARVDLQPILDVLDNFNLDTEDPDTLEKEIQAMVDEPDELRNRIEALERQLDEAEDRALEMEREFNDLDAREAA